MPYLTYNLPLQRTGFRPYGYTNPWSASQLSGMGDALGRPRQVFSEPGGRRLGGVGEFGQWQSGFSPWVLHGMGQIACDPTDVFGSCYDPTAPVGTSGGPGYNLPDVTPAPSSTGGGDCINAASGLPVPCPGTGAGTVAPGPGPAPRVPVSPTLLPATSPVYQTYPSAPGAAAPYGTGYGATQGCPTGYTLSQGKCVTSTMSQVSTYLPWIIGAAAVAMLLAAGKR